MTRDRLDQICEGPIFMLENKDGYVVGNSQFLAMRLRDILKQFDEWLERPSLAVRPITKTDLKILMEKVIHDGL